MARLTGCPGRPKDACAAWAQTEEDAERLRDMGVESVSVLGNLKFDAQPDSALLERGRAWKVASSRPVVLLASSREGEEAALLRLIQQATLPGGASSASIQWLIVPRHPQRFDEVSDLIRAQGLGVSRRSTWGQGAPSPADVWLGDSLGEMPAYYALADVALLGGSFEPLGGQNLIEAAACGCPVLMGPHTFNFAEAARLAEAAGAAKRVNDLSGGISAAEALLRNVEACARMREGALSFAAAHGGTARHTVDALLGLLRTSTTSKWGPPTR